MTRFAPGDFLPKFRADSSINPSFNFDSLAGHRFALVFVASVNSEIGRALTQTLLDEAAWLTKHNILVYVVTTDKRDSNNERLANFTERFTVFFDTDRAIHRLFGMEATPADAVPGTLVLRVGALLVRENLRAQAYVAARPVEGFGERLRTAIAGYPIRVPAQAMQQHAPVLMIPDVVSPAYCRQLIDYYEAHGGGDSGFMRDVDGMTRGMLDPKMKRRKDCAIHDKALLTPLRRALETKVIPEIGKAFGYRVSQVERYIIGCYAAADQGFFKAHRDNTSMATSHRKFAMSLNLNSDEYEGGALRFPEYGPHTYKPGVGCAVIFSCSLLHEATPVTQGRRYVVLPFLYDERGAAQRAETRQFLAEQQAVPGAEPMIPVANLTAA
ncbi:2OG-Fe(II) oxygenase [Thalassobaculum sp.]|uniref:2OG-Fe(II) oxygenase n=1 Tax=Thalassobaculum sp. TaxID=2022740 RepID=UPI0032EFB509